MSGQGIVVRPVLLQQRLGRRAVEPDGDRPDHVPGTIPSKHRGGVSVCLARFSTVPGAGWQLRAASRIKVLFVPGYEPCPRPAGLLVAGSCEHLARWRTCESLIIRAARDFPGSTAPGPPPA